MYTNTNQSHNKIKHITIGIPKVTLIDLLGLYIVFHSGKPFPPKTSFHLKKPKVGIKSIFSNIYPPILRDITSKFFLLVLFKKISPHRPRLRLQYGY